MSETTRPTKRRKREEMADGDRIIDLTTGNEEISVQERSQRANDDIIEISLEDFQSTNLAYVLDWLRGSLVNIQDVLDNRPGESSSAETASSGQSQLRDAATANTVSQSTELRDFVRPEGVIHHHHHHHHHHYHYSHNQTQSSTQQHHLNSEDQTSQSDNSTDAFRTPQSVRRSSRINRGGSFNDFVHDSVSPLVSRDSIINSNQNYQRGLLTPDVHRDGPGQHHHTRDFSEQTSSFVATGGASPMRSVQTQLSGIFSVLNHYFPNSHAAVTMTPSNNSTPVATVSAVSAFGNLASSGHGESEIDFRTPTQLLALNRTPRTPLRCIPNSASSLASASQSHFRSRIQTPTPFTPTLSREVYN